MALMWARMNARIAEHRQATVNATSGGVIIDRGYLGASVWSLMVAGGIIADGIADAIFDDPDVW